MTILASACVDNVCDINAYFSQCRILFPHIRTLVCGSLDGLLVKIYEQLKRLTVISNYNYTLADAYIVFPFVRLSVRMLVHPFTPSSFHQASGINARALL